MQCQIQLLTKTLPIRLQRNTAPTLLAQVKGGPPGSDLNLLTTLGDLLTHNGATQVRLPVGTDGQFLKANSGAAEGIEWDTVNADDLPVAAPGASVDAGDAALEGVALTFVRSDHQHAVSTGAAITVDADTPNAEGVGTDLARADHTHDLPSGVPVSTGTANSEGVSPSLSRIDHVHALSAHVTTHENGGSDELNVGGLSGLLADGQTPLAHAPTHLPSGSDPLTTAAAVTIDADTANAEGVAESFARSDHTHDIPTAVAVDLGTVNAEGISASLARADHVHAHANQLGGSLHAVATLALAGFMSAADKTTFDAHLNPIDTTNPHLVTITQAYVAGGGTTTLNVTQADFEVNGSALGTGTAGNDDGPDYFSIIRGGVNILNTAYNSVDLRAHIYSSAINGMDIGPDPALLPNRSTIRIGMDQLQFLRQDRLIVTGSPGFFLWDSELSLDAAIPLLSRSFGGFIDLGGTFQFNASASPFGMGNALLHRATWKNANAVVANLGPSFLFANNAIYQADGATITASQGRIFFDNATYNVINAGVGSMGAAIGHVSFFANLSINAGWTLALRRGVFIQNATVAGVLTTQVAFDIEDLTSGVANIGIRSVMTAGAQKFFIEHTGSALSLFGGEVEIDGTFNHDGALFGVRGLAPAAISPVWTVTNPAVRRTIDVASATLTELLEYVGTLVLDLQPQGLIG